jgi:hypothetical protein
MRGVLSCESGQGGGILAHITSPCGLTWCFGRFYGRFCAFLLVCLKGVWAFALQETKTNK